MKVYVVFNLTLLMLKSFKKILKTFNEHFSSKRWYKYFNYFFRPILIKMRQDVLIKIPLVD